MIENFLEKQNGNTGWFAPPAGIFQGIVKIINTNTFILEEAHYFTGDIRLSIGNATLVNENVFAWGAGTPAFKNKFG